MKRILICLLFSSLFLLTHTHAATNTMLDTHNIEHFTGYKGSFLDNPQTFKLLIPRTDLTISVSGAKLNAVMGISSWATFQKNGDITYLSSDLALTEDQVNPIISIALRHGLQVTSLNSHDMWASTRLMYLHLEAQGDETTLAKVMGKIFAQMKASAHGNGEIPLAYIDPQHSTLDTKRIDAILGTKGKMMDGVYRVPVYHHPVFTHRMANNNSDVSMHNWAAFAGSNREAIVTGDLAVSVNDLQKVLLALRTAGIDLSAIQPYVNQYNEDNQPLVFLHYWGVGSIHQLANGLHAALLSINAQPVTNALLQSNLTSPTWLPQTYCPI